MEAGIMVSMSLSLGLNISLLEGVKRWSMELNRESELVMWEGRKGRGRCWRTRELHSAVV